MPDPHRSPILLIAVWVTLLFYVTATGAAFAVTYSCCADHSHLNLPGVPGSTEGCCGHGQTATTDGTDTQEEYVPVSPAVCCFGLFQVQRTCQEHSIRSQRAATLPFDSPSMTAVASIAPVHGPFFSNACTGSGDHCLSCVPLTHSLPLLI